MTDHHRARRGEPHGAFGNLIVVAGLTAAFLVLMDLAVAGVLELAERRNLAGSLVRYFEYGRSVPGKLAQWRETPDAPGNLFEAGWMVDQHNDALTGPEAPTGVVRAYGMSFVNNILRAAQSLDPGLAVDHHAGPGAPPNYTYALFLDDAAHRRPGDVAVLGILSSSVPALAALSNRTWVFEQPAPFTYPVFSPASDGGLQRTDPLVTGPAQERALADDPQAQAAWRDQLTATDGFYGPPTFMATWLDRSPFARLVRRALATSYLADRKTEILAEFPYAEVLTRMATDFAARARAEGLLPVVMLIQTRNARDPDLAALLGPVLRRAEIPYLATAEHVDPRDPAAFVGDGHYTRENEYLWSCLPLDDSNRRGSVRVPHPDEPGRDTTHHGSCGDILAHDRIGTDHGTGTDGDVPHDYGPRADLNAVTDHGLRIEISD